MHDPFQTFSTVGTYPGMTTPSNFPYTALQALNPAAFHPLSAILGLSALNPGAGITQMGQPIGMPYNIAAHQLQTAAILAAQAGNPQLFGLSPWQTGLHNPLQAALLANPLIAAALQNPFINHGIQNPLFGGAQQNPLQAALLGNPLAAGMGNPYSSGYQNPMLNPVYAALNPWAGGLLGHQQYSPYSQMGQIGPQTGQFGSQFGQTSPYGQTSAYSQIGYPLAPQSWIGQGGPYGGGQAFGQVHPLLQTGGRPFQVPGFGSWGQ
jgi:hypothetical protein